VLDGKEEIRAAWLSYKEARKLTGLGRTTLWRLAKEGKIPVAGHGRARRLNREALERFMWSCVGNSPSEAPEDRR
jgi:excisionase family DNA binding protein